MRQSKQSDSVLSQIERAILAAFAQLDRGQRLSGDALGYILCRRPGDSASGTRQYDTRELDAAMSLLLTLGLVERGTGGFVMTDGGWVMAYEPRQAVSITQRETPRAIEHAVLGVLVRYGGLSSYLGIGKELCVLFDRTRIREAIDRLERSGDVVLTFHEVWITDSGRARQARESAGPSALAEIPVPDGLVIAIAAGPHAITGLRSGSPVS